MEHVTERGRQGVVGLDHLWHVLRVKEEGVWSVARLWVNGVDLGSRFEGTYAANPSPRIGSCDPWVDWESWNDTMKQDIMTFAMASMDALQVCRKASLAFLWYTDEGLLQNWFFWTWKIGNSTVSGKVEAPAWSYQLGLQNGWMPKDPRSAEGTCQQTDPFQGPLQPWQTGGAGAGQIPASFTQSWAWPPTTISGGGPVSLLPTYTQTGPIPTLPAPTFTKSAGGTIDAGNGWFNAADNTGMAVPIPTCSYLDPWVGTADPPSPLCTPAAKRDVVPQATITPAP